MLKELVEFNNLMLKKGGGYKDKLYKEKDYKKGGFFIERKQCD